MVQMTAHNWEPYVAWLWHTIEYVNHKVNIWLLFGKTHINYYSHEWQVSDSPQLSIFNNAIGCFVSCLIPIGGLLKFWKYIHYLLLCFTVAERAQRAATSENTCKLRKQLSQFYNAHAANAHNTTKKRNALQIENTFVNLTTHMLQTQPKKKRAANKMYLVVLWAFAVCFFICLCCEHLHHLLSKWWKCFLDLLVLFLFARVFWSCSALSSLCIIFIR